MFYIGQIIKNIHTNIIGSFVKEFKVTGRDISIKIICIDGREYCAPKEEWIEA